MPDDRGCLLVAAVPAGGGPGGGGGVQRVDQRLGLGGIRGAQGGQAPFRVRDVQGTLRDLPRTYADHSETRRGQVWSAIHPSW